MILPTPEEIAAAKADALSRFGRDEALLVRVHAPVDFAMLVAPLDLADLSDFSDKQLREVDGPKRGLVLGRRLWPSASTVLEAVERRPALPNKVVAKLLERAGHSNDESRVRLLADVLAEDSKPEDDVIPGLTRAKATELMSSGDELWTVVGPGPLSLVMATPDPDVYLAARAADARARAKRERYVEAKLDFARPLVRWTARPMDALLDDQPMLAGDIKDAFDFIAGEGADADSKSV